MGGKVTEMSEETPSRRLSGSTKTAAKLPELDEIEVQEVSDHDRFSWQRHAAQLLLLHISLLAGVFVMVSSSGASMGQAWKTVFVAMATLCIGFGAGILFYRRFRDLQLRMLAAEYRSLRTRADELVGDFDRYQDQMKAR